MRFISVGSAPLMRLGLLSGFKQLGHTIGHFPHHSWHTLSEGEGKKLLWKYLIEFKPDYLIAGGYAPKYFEYLSDLCKSHNAKLIYWAIEDPVGFNNSLFLAKKADYVFTTTKESIVEYKKHGIDAHLLMFACNPNYHKKGKFNPEYKVDLALAASCYHWPTRKLGYKIILDAAKESGCSLKVWGAGWQNETCQKILGNSDYYCGYFPNGQLPSLCTSAKILLGIQCDGTSLTQTSMRPYEVLGCRGFHLTQWTKATANLFKDNEHLITARTKEEALDKIKYYMKHPAYRNKIARQGQEFVYNNHTYKHRVKDDIFPVLGIKQ